MRPRPVVVGLACLLPLLPCPQPQPAPAPTYPTAKPPPAAVHDTRLAARPRGPLIALSDNRPETIVDRRFQATGIRRIRVIVPYDDVARGGRRLAVQDSWFGTARANGIEPLVSFERSYGSKKRLPSVAQYRRDFRLFRARYPWVRYFSTWSEANFPSAQPTGNYPIRTAQFYKVARRECSGGRCTVLTMDFRADGSPHATRWLRTFKRYIGRGPHIWGLVSHPDVNRLSTRRTRQFLRATRGDVWATEIGAVNFFGRGFRPSIRRQTRAMRYMMYRYPGVSRRLKRMYIYHWRAARGDHLWDSALLSTNGKRRPSYYIFFRAIGKRAP
jgi:hypothetical protein